MTQQQTDSGSASLTIALAQLNLVVGDIHGNTQQVLDAAREARDELHADLVIFPELTLTGYPPEDLLLRPGLHRQVSEALAWLQREVRGIDLLIGYPHQHDGQLYNACALLHDGESVARYDKQSLPNYGVFDEKRYFVPGDGPCVVEIRGIPVALTICEDIWSAEPARQARDAGAQLLININASPFHSGKSDEREQLLAQRAREANMPIAYVNLVGGQDELVFDGHSLVVDATGKVALRAPSFESGLYIAHFQTTDNSLQPLPTTLADIAPPLENAYHALVTGVRDYVHKNHFKGAVIGLSGGIDSALTLAIAVDALGAEAVEAVSMPSRYTADMSIEDARLEAEALGIGFRVIPIEPVFNAFLDSLEEAFASTEADTTEENLQARTRGVLLMAISNKHGKLVLTTGNKSEMAVGYATLYGDMAGGFAPLKDVEKMDVYHLSDWRNQQSPVIPQRVLDRPPSAELRPDQVDQDSLPPYPDLDAILKFFVEQDKSPDEIVAQGYSRETVERIAGMVLRNEYKRRQAAPGVRITQRAFGRDRRYPITSGYKQHERMEPSDEKD